MVFFHFYFILFSKKKNSKVKTDQRQSWLTAQAGNLLNFASFFFLTTLETLEPTLVGWKLLLYSWLLEMRIASSSSKNSVH